MSLDTQGDGNQIPAPALPRRAWAPDDGTLAGLLRLMGADTAADTGADRGARTVDLTGAARVPVPVRRVVHGDTLFHENASAEAIYFVRSGTFKTFRTAEDGYEQVLCFAGRGELLGLDAVCIGRHPNASVALEDSSVYALTMQDIFTLGRRFPVLDRALLMAASSQLTHSGEIADVMAAVAAESRLARFLLQYSARMQANGQSPRRFVLRMTRRDIASQLGLAHETISRSFSALAASGCVQVNNREVSIVDLAGLRVMARSTRGPLDEAARSGTEAVVAPPLDPWVAGSARLAPRRGSARGMPRRAAATA